MGFVSNSTANAINCSLPDSVDTLVTGYLRRKIKQKPAKSADDMQVTRQRLWNKITTLETKLAPPRDTQARETFLSFSHRLPEEMNLVRTSRVQSLPSSWSRQIAYVIESAYFEDSVRADTEAYLFSHIDVHADLATNLDRLTGYGQQLESAIVPHKEFVRQEVQRYTDPHFLAVMHNNKCKSEYAKWAKQCARDINFTTSPVEARAALESYFWEKLYVQNGPTWNQQHQVVKLDHLLKTLTNHRDLAVHVYGEVSDEARVTRDLDWKSTILNIDYRIASIAESAGISPPYTSGRMVQVDLARMANARSSGFAYY